MTILQTLQQELELEAQTTRKMLERVPDEKFDWQPHPKSMTLKRLATHIADLSSWAKVAITTDELDFANNPYKEEDVQSTAQLVDYFERSLAEGKAHLAAATEEELEKPWTMRSGDQIYDTSPKRDVIRHSISQTIHHRAQLGVYLRLLDVPIPGSYGPSADEMEF